MFGNPFGAYDATSLLIDTQILTVREAHSTREITQLPSNLVGVEMVPEEAILRMPIERAVALDLATKGVTTPTVSGRVAACLRWDEVQRSWVNDGVRQAQGSGATKEMCVAGAPGQLECFFFLECFTNHLSYFSAANTFVDCTGRPLGDARYDSCQVCFRI